MLIQEIHTIIRVSYHSILEPKSGCTSLAKWFFYQIDLLQTALNYSPFIHNYEYDIYKNAPAYSLRLGIALREKQKKLLNLFVTLIREQSVLSYP